VVGTQQRHESGGNNRNKVVVSMLRECGNAARGKTLRMHASIEAQLAAVDK
jgi:hypothetical protein